MNPETQEKLLQLQKYQEQKLRDPVPQTTAVSTVKTQPFNAENIKSEFESPKKSSEQDNSRYFYFFNYSNSVFIYCWLVSIGFFFLILFLFFKLLN